MALFDVGLGAVRGIKGGGQLHAWREGRVLLGGGGDRS